jgi:hypothetical protein
MAMEPLIGASDARFDSRNFTWLGSATNEVSVCATFAGAKVKTWDDALASRSPSAATAMRPTPTFSRSC